jgi:hypothetical protein
MSETNLKSVSNGNTAEPIRNGRTVAPRVDIFETDWFRLRRWRQGKRAEEANVDSIIGRWKSISADNNRADFALAA